MTAPAAALHAEEAGALAGDQGPAMALAMRLLLVAARTQRAPRLIPVTAGYLMQVGVGGPVTLLSLLIRTLELFVAFLQAYIFTFLATLRLSRSTRLAMFRAG